ncbi:NAD(P)-binding protein [Temperatibacter marinus]|uniref:NAD(P)-binding protein n=1 Tax=Temperatibacter marinus TaxID=1456591 RepID=A0AA52EI32_9PROT|nr:NAD(P)-binding protein [Temperatibacter marinus]WND02714.1 NAD(P)-binding protein [Temperatibacter marinus]
MQTIAIIGAGLSGLTAAHHLKGQYSVQVFEKARGVSGRMSTRHAPPYQFDHGAQFFTVNSPEFKAFLEKKIFSPYVSEWQGQFVTIKGGVFTPYHGAGTRYVGVDKMTSLCKEMAKELCCTLGINIQGIEYRSSEGFTLTDQLGKSYGPYDKVISAIPLPQFLDLCSNYIYDKRVFNSVIMQGCISLMLGGENLPLPEFDGAKVEENLLGWIAVNSRKPGRRSPSSLIVQSTNIWAEKMQEQDLNDVKGTMLTEVENLLQVSYHSVGHSQVHRWRYAAVTSPLGQDFWQHNDLPLYAVGDWCLGGKVEKAFLSGYRLAYSL